MLQSFTVFYKIDDEENVISIFSEETTPNFQEILSERFNRNVLVQYVTTDIIPFSINTYSKLRKRINNLKG